MNHYHFKLFGTVLILKFLKMCGYIVFFILFYRQINISYFIDNYFKPHLQLLLPHLLLQEHDPVGGFLKGGAERIPLLAHGGQSSLQLILLLRHENDLWFEIIRARHY